MVGSNKGPDPRYTQTLHVGNFGADVVPLVHTNRPRPRRTANHVADIFCGHFRCRGAHLVCTNTKIPKPSRNRIAQVRHADPRHPKSVLVLRL